MAFATINYYSHSLDKASSFNVVFPDSPDAERPWAVYYLLHGLSDDHTTWMRRTCIERYTLGIPIMVVMPNGGRNWFTNAQEGEAYEDDLIKDVIGLIEKDFPVKAERNGRAIGGVSMGGYGAVKLGLKYPDRFGSVNSQSGVLGLLRHPIESRRISPEFPRIFGKSGKDGSEDPFHLAEKIDRDRLPALRIDCGHEDPFLYQNRSFHEHLKSLDIPHEYQEFQGSHHWHYWDLHVREAVHFHVRSLNIPENPEHLWLR